jgi:mono/diheme cytochrome c family protein
MKPRRPLFVLGALAVALSAAGCGSRGVEVSKTDPTRTGAVIFAERCGGCHTLDVAGTQGSSTKIRDRERVDGPNFNTRPENVDYVLYAIRNGGASGAIMPENIVVGEEARKVAEFLAKYAGRQAKGKSGG